MTALTAHKVVLNWHESLNRDPGMRDDITPTGPQRFTTEEVPPFAEIPGTVVRLDYDTWQDMGGPTTITVTVESGDHLNP